jgi:hypothetical protein
MNDDSSRIIDNLEPLDLTGLPLPAVGSSRANSQRRLLVERVLASFPPEEDLTLLFDVLVLVFNWHGQALWWLQTPEEKATAILCQKITRLLQLHKEARTRESNSHVWAEGGE